MGGEAASGLVFARDNPARALACIPVDGAHQAHSWDLASGRVVTSTDGRILTPTISPDGQWLWWFDADTRTWWRRPFGSSPRGHRERPLRLRPSPHSELALGADGTAVVARVVPGYGVALSLLPVGRVRPGAEPALLGAFPSVRGLARSHDDLLIAVDTGARIEVRSAYTGALVGVEESAEPWHLGGFSADSAVLLQRHGEATDEGGPPPIAAARLWYPREGRHHLLDLDRFTQVTRIHPMYRGQGLLVESAPPTDPAQLIVSAVNLSTGEARRLGPRHGTILLGTSVGGPQGRVFAQWRGEDTPARMIELTAGASPAPVVGGYGSL